MHTRPTVYVQLTQSLFQAFQTRFHRTQPLEQMLLLQDLRHNLSNEVPLGFRSQRMQTALHILQRLSCIETFYNRRYQELLASEMLPDQQNRHIEALRRRCHQQMLRLESDWPGLDSFESDALPRLLLLQRIEQEIEQLNTVFKFQLNSQQVAA